ncbi:nitrogenase component 1, partial [Methanospirillum hungatei]|uniref:nitrogenase component 1 n=1 Tax=Methanospirillum hungatei TaxID=2203 RepID=UPI0026EEA2CB
MKYYNPKGSISRIAVYGKGGIGKSTISANISAALSDEGHSVLHIGCDPKHDSTRTLLGELHTHTVTDFFRASGIQTDYSVLIRTGYNGIACIEAGGPEPGVGCAGRGILSTFEILKQIETDSSRYTYTIYDVLGDVVCGGFAVPLRHGYADIILIVTSGEYMSLYAANNILRGIHNYDGNIQRIGGIIYNSRGGAEEDEQVKKFSHAVSLPILVKIPRSEIFLTAERHSKTVVAAFPNSQETLLFRKLVSEFFSTKNPIPRYPAHPLDVIDLESLILGRDISGFTSFSHQVQLDVRPGISYIDNGTGHYTIPKKPPLFGCAFAGAIAVLAQIRDASVIAHCPSSCAHIVSNLLISSQNRDCDKSDHHGKHMSFSFIHTRMDEKMMVFGGIEELKKTIVNSVGSGKRVIFIVSGCTPGITGDDIVGCSSEMSQNLGIPIIPVPVNGIGEGDFSAGTMAGYHASLQLVKQEAGKKIGSVVIVGEKILANNTTANFNELNHYLSTLDIPVSCRFLTYTSVNELESMSEQSIILPASSDKNTLEISKIISEKTGLEIFPHSFPYTFHETVRWIEDLADRFSVRDMGSALIARNEKIYCEEIALVKQMTSGKRVIIASSGPDISWVLEVVRECEMEIICAGFFSSPYTTKHYQKDTDPSIVMDYSPDALYDDIKTHHPDLVLTTIWLDHTKA